MHIKLSKEDKELMIAKIQDHFYREHSEEIGELAAGNFLHFIVKEVGPYIYNQGVQDAKDLVEQKMMSLEEDMYALERPVHQLFPRDKKSE